MCALSFLINDASIQIMTGRQIFKFCCLQPISLYVLSALTVHCSLIEINIFDSMYSFIPNIFCSIETITNHVCMILSFIPFKSKILPLNWLSVLNVTCPLHIHVHIHTLFIVYHFRASRVFIFHWFPKYWMLLHAIFSIIMMEHSIQPHPWRIVPKFWSFFKVCYFPWFESE